MSRARAKPQSPSHAKSQDRKSSSQDSLQLHSKPHQLAEFLRQSIRDHTLTLPLPGVRLWSQQLGVSRRTLHTALHTLQSEGWVTLHPRGTRLNPSPTKGKSTRPTPPKQVRWLSDATHPQIQQHVHNTYELLHERLKVRGISLISESCTPTRLREIARHPGSPGELLLLGSLAPTYQRLFAASSKPALVFGEVAPHIPLPFVNVDQAGTVRHATFRVLRQGCTHVILVHINSKAPGMRSSLTAFKTACKEWTRSTVTPQCVSTHLDRTSLLSTMRRLVPRVKSRTGILVLSPVPISMVVTALLQHGISVPKQAEVIALLHPEGNIQLYPTPPAYRWPKTTVVRQLTTAIEQFFATGNLPNGGNAISAEIAKL